MYRVEKILSGDLELLPDLVDTPIWADYDEFSCKRSVKTVACLYSAIEKRENYYQFNTPSAFGDSMYSYYCGVVQGILLASEMEEDNKDDQIVIRKGKKRILVIDKVKRPGGYYESVRENSEVWRELGL